MKQNLGLSLSIMLSAACFTASAQEKTMLDSVIVHENRIQAPFGNQNRNIQIIDSKQISMLPVKSVNELLAYASGVDIRQRGVSGTQADISIDGSTFDQVLILLNGVKMSDPQTGHHMLNIPVPLSAIDHIEILRGPAARTYGLNALAGAVNIVTKQTKTNFAAVQLYAGSSLQTDSATGNTYYGWGAQATVGVGGKTQSHLISLAHDEGNGYQYNTAFKANRIFYQNHIDLNSKNNIEAMGGYINNSFGANGFYAAPKDVNSTETVQTVLGSVGYNYHPSSKFKLAPRISYRYNSDDYIFIKQNPSVYQNYHETEVVTGELQSSVELGKGVLGAGIEYRYENINSSNLGKRDRNNLGLYAEYKHSFSARLNAGAGLYGNYNSNYGWQLFPGVDIGYNVNNNWKIFANAATGERLPTYTDLYYKGPTNIGNAQLTPEHAYYAEGGLQWNRDVLFARATYFYRRTTDFIDWVKANPTDAWQPQNFQSINAQGFTAQVNYNVGKRANMPEGYKLMIGANYTYLQPVIETPAAEISKYAVEALRHQFTASLQSLFFNRIQLDINTRYLYRINANDYTLMDVRIAYRQKHWALYADVNNLLDTHYKEISTVQLPGRWYTIGLKLDTTWK